MSLEIGSRLSRGKSARLAHRRTQSEHRDGREAAEAHGVAPRQIAKTLSLRLGDRVALIVVAGDARLDNRKVKAAFGAKPRLLDAAEVVGITGHPVGGVCPFGLATPLAIYCDASLRDLGEVVPAAGAVNAAVRVDAARLAALVGAQWVDVCQDR